MAATQLRVAVVQFAPRLGQVQANIAKARELCKGLKPRSLDLLCLPEMAFSGYVFPDPAAIAPYLEHPHTGPTATFCAELARRLECFVAAGYPEKLGAHVHAAAPHGGEGASLPFQQQEQPRTGANSAVVYGPAGERVGAYRKTNLFALDLPWAVPGSGFATMALPHPLGRTTLAICNDLNVQEPATWESLEAGPYELAQHCMRSGTRLLILLNAWLHPGEGEEESDGSLGDSHIPSGQDDVTDEMEPSWEVIKYWALRLHPLWATVESTANETDRKQSEHKAPDELLIVICNRFGDEGGKTFAGSSVLMSLRRGSGRPRILHMMGQREEGVGVWTANVRAQ